jgi:hypothetical protein
LQANSRALNPYFFSFEQREEAHVSQRKQILNHLLAGNSITPLEALGVFGCFRLAARIEELRDDGYAIDTELREDPKGKKYARYTMPGTVAA